MIHVVSELWNDLEAHPSEVPVSPEIIAELDPYGAFPAAPGRIHNLGSCKGADSWLKIMIDLIFLLQADLDILRQDPEAIATSSGWRTRTNTPIRQEIFPRARIDCFAAREPIGTDGTPRTA